MGPSIRLMGYRDPWWDATGRLARRRRRRRLAAFGAVVILGASLGLAVAEARAAEALPAMQPAGAMHQLARTWS